MGASPDAFCPLRPALPTKEFDDISCHAWHGNKMPYPPVPPGRIDSTAAIRSPKTVHRTRPQRNIGCAARADAGFARRRRSSWLASRADSLLFVFVASSRQSMCGEAGPKRTKYATLLIRGRAVVARGALRRITLIGRCHTLHHTRQTSQPGSGDAPDDFSACDDHQKRSGYRDVTLIGEYASPAAPNTSRS